jgi:hypothetical protein
MKCQISREIQAVYTAQTITREEVKNLVLSASAEYDPGEAEAIVDRAYERAIQIEQNGLTICRHKSGELRGFVLTTLDLHPYTMGQYLDRAVGAGYYVNSDYYGSKDSPKAIAHGFTEADLGSVFFVVRATDTSTLQQK